MELFGFIEVGKLADSAHKAIKEEKTLLNDLAVLLLHGILVGNGWHIQAEEARI